MHDLPIALLGIDGSGLLMFANQAALKLFEGKLGLCRPAAAMLPAEIVSLIDAPAPAHGHLMLDGQTYSVQVQTLSHKGQGQLIAIFPSAEPC